MAAILEGFVIETRFHGTSGGQDVNNIIHGVVDEVVGTVLLSNYVEAATSLWLAEVCPVLSEEYLFARAEALVITGRLNLGAGSTLIYGDMAIVTPPAPEPGGVEGPALPSYVSASVRKITGGVLETGYEPSTPDPSPVAGEKRFKGRLGLGTLPEEYTEGAGQNALTAVAVTALSDAADSLLSITATNGLGNQTTVDMVVLSQSLRGIRRSVGEMATPIYAFQPVVSLFVNPNVGSQLSRKAPPGG